MIQILIAYFALLLIVTRRLDERDGTSHSNAAFYRGERRSSWLMVAYGMVGASVSGVSFVSVPGMTLTQGMTYLQTCLGFIPGYFLVAFVLLPIFYRLNLTSIYMLLEMRLGRGAYRTGAWFFLVSDMLGSAVKFLLVCVILQRFVMDDLDVPFVLTVPLLILCIWLYTRRGGVRTLVYTDVLQTTCMLVALALIIVCVCLTLSSYNSDVNIYNGVVFKYNGVVDIYNSVVHTQTLSPFVKIFEFDDWTSRQYFWKQFVSGAFIVVVMTGLNQNMMQKNLTCRSLRDAQKNMCLSGLLFLPVNALFLILGVLLIVLFQQSGVELPTAGDDLLPIFIEQAANHGDTALYSLITNPYSLIRIAFVLGIVSAAFSTADSSLTALTTCYCVDIAARPDDVRLRRRVHVVMAAVLILAVYALRAAGNGSLIDLVYTLVSYTYGPLLGLFALALLCRKTTADIPLRICLPVCIAAPVVCYMLNLLSPYKFGYELLLINALLTALPLGAYLLRLIHNSASSISSSRADWM